MANNGEQELSLSSIDSDVDWETFFDPCVQPFNEAQRREYLEQICVGLQKRFPLNAFSNNQD